MKEKGGRILIRKDPEFEDEMWSNGEEVEDFLHAKIIEYKDRYFVVDMGYLRVEKETENREEALEYAKSLERTGQKEYQRRFCIG